MPEAPENILTPGTVLGNYRVERLLGRGGMGAVFLAHDNTLHRSVALKVLIGSAEADTAWTSLLREARSAAALNHPNICMILEVDTSDSGAFIAMEYVEGPSLRERIDSGGLKLEEAIRYGIQVADALEYAHDHGVVHRDFKAANVILAENDSRAKIVDFGLARREDRMLADATTMASLVPAGSVMGTPYAMAPEQIRGEHSDARTDIWALGVLLYEMVCGMKPFEGPTTPELFSSILRDSSRALPQGIPADLRGIINRCLNKAPENRYQKAAEVRSALESVRLDTALPWIGQPLRMDRRWFVRAAAAVGATAFGVALGLYVGALLHWIRKMPVSEWLYFPLKT